VGGLLARRIGRSLLVFLFVLSAVFVLLELLPGGPGAVTEDARVPADQQQRLRHVLGLDRPAPERYVRFLVAAVHGDWGVSFSSQRPVAGLVAEAARPTLELGAAALAIEFLLGVPLGALAARWAGGRFDRLLRGGSLLLWSVPSFWLGLAMVLVFAVLLPWAPAGGIAAAGGVAGGGAARTLDTLAHLALPALALGLPAAAGLARFARSALLEVAGEPFVLAARARGLPPLRLFVRYELLPASASLIQLLGFSVGSLLSGALAIEIVFSRPGLGRLTYDALAARDYPVLLATAALAAAMVLAASVVAELLHAMLDPRVRRADETE